MTRSICYSFIKNAGDSVSHIDYTDDVPSRVKVFFTDPSVPSENTQEFVYSSSLAGERTVWRLSDVASAISEFDILLSSHGTPWAVDMKEAKEIAESYRRTLPLRLSDFVGDQVEETVQIILFFEMIYDRLELGSGSRVLVDLK